MKLLSSDGQQYSVDQPEVTLGRETDNMIVCDDQRVSGHHATIRQDGNLFILTDLGSTNGTFANGVQLSAPYTLNTGDSISLGGYVLTVQTEDEQAYAPTAYIDTPYEPPAAEQPVAPEFLATAAIPEPPAAPAYQPPAYTPAPQGAASYDANAANYASANPPAYTPPANQPAYAPPAYPQQAPAPMYQGPGYQAPMYQNPYGMATKDKSTALILELLPGFFGFMGIGWLYAGQTGTGIAFLIGYFVYLTIAGIGAMITVGFSLCLTVPLGWGILAISAVSLNNYTKQHPELFRP